MSRTRILIVEDEALVAAALSKTLEDIYCEVAGIVSSAETAVERAAQTRPDVVIMDVMLEAGSDGIQAAEKIKSELDIPVIYLTSYTDDTILQRAKLTQPYGYLIKPVSQRELQSTIQIALYKHQMERQLKEREEHYRIVADFTHDWEFWMGIDGRLVYVSPSCERVTGYSADEFMARPSMMLEIVHPEDRAIVRRHFVDSLKQGAELDGFDYRIVHRNGEIRWIAHECKPVYNSLGEYRGRRASNRDISQRKEAEEALRESEGKYRCLVELAPDGIILSVDGIIVFANPAAARILCATEPDQLVGRAVTDLVHPDYHDLTKARMAMMHDESPTVPLIEEQFIRLDGTPLDVEVASSLFNYEGKVAVQTVLRDITERKRAEGLVIRAARIAAVADLASGVAHNFNNWLQIIMMGAHLASVRCKAQDYTNLPDLLDQILVTCQQASATVKRLQSFAGLRPSMEHSEGTFDMSDAVLHAIDITQLWWKTIPESSGLRIELVSDLQKGCMIKGREDQVFEVAVNLIKNACEALPHGGAIQVQTRVQPDMAVLTVSDNGVGIPANHLAKVFEPFFTTKGLAVAGMGLASSFGIVARHGGQIKVDSSEGEGSLFMVTLPLSENNR